MSKIYRHAVFALALGYTIRMVVFSDYAEPLGPFRFLTIWALLFSLVSAWLMLRRSLGITNQRFETWVSVTTVLNAMVVFLYWKLYFADPTSVTRDA